MNSKPYSLGDMLQSIAERGRTLLGLPVTPEAPGPAELAGLCEKLLSSKSEASGVALAGRILAGWERLGDGDRTVFLANLIDQFGPDRGGLEAAIEAYRADPGPEAAAALHQAAEPRRQELIRRLNLGAGGTAALVRMRATLTEARRPELAVVDADFEHLLSSWFNRGFLTLERIDWSTPASILERIIKYEAVHEIRDWNELRRRIEPPDRRCFAFFHPQLPGEPLIFVEVALTTEIPRAIEDLLVEDRPHIPEFEATTAVFYSISNTQAGLRGITFGNFLIKQVIEELQSEMKKLSTAVTLSPAPGFARWLRMEREAAFSDALSPADREALGALDGPWLENEAVTEALRLPLLRAAAYYFIHARTPDGRVIDPVARFHLGNGARLEAINFLGDRSAKGLDQAHGLMINYLYKLDDIEKNHEAYAGRGEVVTSSPVRRHLGARTHSTGRA